VFRSGGQVQGLVRAKLGGDSGEYTPPVDFHCVFDLKTIIVESRRALEALSQILAERLFAGDILCPNAIPSAPIDGDPGLCGGA
jgi:hypothetical protein